MDIDRMIVIVLDGVGAGEAPDAALYGDRGSNSLSNTARAVGGLDLPNFAEMGFGYITPMEGVPLVETPSGAYGKMQPKSAGKDTISGHWELMGVCLPDPLPTYPDGFPVGIVEEFSRRTGRGVIGNKPASGTVIIQELGLEHMRTGKLIVYTSADSVFQIAAHEGVVPIEEQYRICGIAREMLKGEHAVGRVIARPFLGDEPGEFWRTERRRDFPLRPPSQTALDRLVKTGRQVYSVGKIDDIFGGRGISKSNHTLNNQDSLLAIMDFLEEDFQGLLFANLIEFDMVYGHRNDPQGYAQALKKVDDSLPGMKSRMRDTDLAMFVADHGVDPTTPSTDHSREYVPLLVFGERVRRGVDLGRRETLADVSETIAEVFALEPFGLGVSFLDEILGV